MHYPNYPFGGTHYSQAKRLRQLMCALLIAAALLSPAACTDTREANRSASPSAVVSTPADPAASARTAVITAYTAMWNAWAQAGETSDYQSPDLPRYASGDALATLVNGLKANSEKQRYFRGRPTLHAAVVDLSLKSEPAIASILDCADSASWQTVDAAGRPVSDNTGKRKITATVTRLDGVWKVSTFTVRPGGSC